MEQLTEELLVKECDNLADELWDEVFGDGDPITPRDFREIVYDVASHFVNRKFVREEGDGADNALEDEIKKHIQNCLDVKFPTLDVESIKRDVEYTARHFAKWQKEQMMKDAIDASINTYEEVGGNGYVEFVADVSPSKYKEKENVKLIIIEEE